MNADYHFHDARNWFFQARFGLFIHWGLYAIHGWHEQEQMRAGVPRAEYEKLAESFSPQKFDPGRWLDLAQQAGMKYVCFTAKHHDGFCLWDSAQTDYKVTRTPFGRDIVAELATACHHRGVPLCLYYSVVDWHHPNYPNRGQSHELDHPEPGDEPDVNRYLEYLKAQVRELCTNYGPIHGIWWDMNQTGVRDPSIHEMIRQLQPAAVINNRGFADGDISTPERNTDAGAKEARVYTRPTEACNSVGAESWGYRADEDYYTPEYLIRQIDSTLAKGGNYLLNAGPDADGVIPEQAADRLRRIGDWLTRVGESLWNASPISDQTDNPSILLTRSDHSIYVHLAERPFADGVALKPLNALPRRAVLLNNGQSVSAQVVHLPNTHKDRTPQLHLRQLPISQFGNEVMVVRLDYGK